MKVIGGGGGDLLPTLLVPQRGSPLKNSHTNIFLPRNGLEVSKRIRVKKDFLLVEKVLFLKLFPFPGMISFRQASSAFACAHHKSLFSAICCNMARTSSSYILLLHLQLRLPTPTAKVKIFVYHVMA